MRLHVKPGLPLREAIIRTDREKLYAILTNLVKNAIKFTTIGSIEFGYRPVGDMKFLEFFVKDTGIGIQKDRQEAVFERFIQADILDTMAYQGAGLGLSISKAYVEMLGGKIRMESEPGKGTVFYFTIPYAHEPEVKTAVKNVIPIDRMANQVKKLEILIAEDDETSERYLIKAVEMVGKKILRVRTGDEAVEACLKNPGIDLVLMDIKMPGINGYEATRRIRQFNKDVIIIAQTAYGLLGDKDKALDAGCNEYLSKPIVGDDLQKLLQKYALNKLT